MKKIKLEVIIESEDNINAKDIIVQQHDVIDGFEITRNNEDITDNFYLNNIEILKCEEV